MESRSHALIAGLFTLLLIAISTAFALWLGKDDISRTPYLIATQLKVAGLNEQAAVRYKGIKVGRVSSVDFDKQHPGQLLIKIEINSETPLSQGSYASLGYQGVTGIAYIEIDDDGSNPMRLQSDLKNIANIPLRPGLLQNLEAKGLAILQQTEQVTTKLNTLLDSNNQASLMGAVQQIQRSAKAWEVVPAQLQPSLQQMPATLAQIQQSMTNFSQFSQDARRTSQNLGQLANTLQSPDGALMKLQQSVQQLEQTMSNETLPRIHGLTKEAQGSLRSIQGAADNLKERPQSILFGNKAPLPGPGETGYVPQRAH
jgi:phospholipid/cholesterol/gamma-HCH transport system substrate-binding protein